MKTTIIAFVCTLLSLTVGAQNEIPSGSWSISSIGHQKGILLDRYNTMSIDWMRAHTRNEDVVAVEDDVDYEVMNMASVTGQQMGINLGLTAPAARLGKWGLLREIRIAATVVTGREAMVQYSNTENPYIDPIEKSLIFCLIDNEINLAAAYLLKKRMWKIDLGLGLGGLIGTNFNPEMLIIRNSYTPSGVETQNPVYTSTTDYYRAYHSIFGRAFIPVTMGMWLGKKVELLAEGRVGTGSEWVHKNVHSIGTTWSGTVGVRWHFDTFVP